MWDRPEDEATEQTRFVLGVTGNIAVGKSTVVKMLAVRGATVIDADRVYHELIAPGQPLLEKIRERFGDGVIREDGSLDRPALGAIVFNDDGALADLDRITHPAVIAEIDRRVASASGVVVIDAVKLVESGHADTCDAVWLVVAETGQQVARLIECRGLTRADAERRVTAQPPLRHKLERADVIIDNSGTIAATEAQVAEAWSLIPESIRAAATRVTSRLGSERHDIS
ncbi:MAG: dephospho-CoA kinase [Chloroflexota bacterium]|nr:dephospho-CoA kinase [Chloroflexota bacterium]